ncbi:MAG: hypothetical protein CMI03_08705 [Oceanospirillaceae bacterium]|uniref:hypothetical protein n=1 Tax=Thalassolituus sp. UBA1505 TaxID=1947653 RepID=UPI000C3901A8|nr:hypothetical protein [Thalassolituus sp. UBA1505]MBS52817.1 hypothetical protein [Oceanospirillaceae bacterium]|tara:strand:+ start:519 stop:1061 length:543 start_codon:yes stop_codon:yes gene_type:complete
MRTLKNGLMVAFLAAALPAFADVASDVKDGLTAEVVMENALEACGADCSAEEKAAIIEQMVDAGLALETIAEVALIQGMSISDVVAGMNAAGIEATVLATAISNGAAKAAENGATFADADGNLIAVEDVGTLVLAAITAELGNTAAGTTPTAGLTPIITIPTVSSPPPQVIPPSEISPTV